MQTVGELLRSEREKRNLSIKEIEAATSIRSLYINAIEEDNYSIIPGEVYLKGFIRNYANFLGLNGQQMVELYRQSQQVPEPVEEIAVPEVPETLTEKLNKRKKKSTSTWLLVSVFAIFIAGACWLFFSPKPAQEPESMQSKQTTPASPSKTTPNSSSTASSTQKPVAVVAKYTDQCWTMVTADGTKIYEGIPKTGDTVTWEAQKNITLTVGNAAGIEITANGQSIGKLGAKGEVVVKNFSPK